MRWNSEQPRDASVTDCAKAARSAGLPSPGWWVGAGHLSQRPGCGRLRAAPLGSAPWRGARAGSPASPRPCACHCGSGDRPRVTDREGDASIAKLRPQWPNRGHLPVCQVSLDAPRQPEAPPADNPWHGESLELQAGQRGRAVSPAGLARAGPPESGQAHDRRRPPYNGVRPCLGSEQFVSRGRSFPSIVLVESADLPAEAVRSVGWSLQRSYCLRLR